MNFASRNWVRPTGLASSDKAVPDRISLATDDDAGIDACSKIDPKVVYAQGQSMGGMYTNLIGATEPRVGAVVPGVTPHRRAANGVTHLENPA